MSDQATSQSESGSELAGSGLMSNTAPVSMSTREDGVHYKRPGGATCEKVIGSFHKMVMIGLWEKLDELKFKY